MSPEIDLRDRLEHELGHLPSRPADAYLREGRRVRRRRRAASVAAAAVVSVAAVQLVAPGGSGREDSIADEPTATREAMPDLTADPDFVAPEPNNPVEAQEGLEGVDWFTTDDIPAYAQEHGNHGPVAVTPEGRLWVAPDATIRRVVVDPYPPGEQGITASYAVEAQCTCAPEDMPDGIVWVVLGTNGTDEGPGLMDIPGGWTNDFELWVDQATAYEQGRPSIAERFAHFADQRTGRMVAGAPGVELVHQEPEADLGSGRVRHTRAGAAEVVYAGQTFYVVGVDPENGAPWYRFFDGDTRPDFASFLKMLRGNW